jgi:uncharacterized membrane protein YcaP (DUF421 family)
LFESRSDVPGEADFQPLDLERMFIGDFSFLLLLEIMVRTAVMYMVALGLVRFIGKRGLGQLSPFEYLVVIAMGSATGDPMFYPEVPLIHGALVLAIIVALQKTFFKLTQQSGLVATFIESTPTLLVDHGVMLEERMKEEGISEGDLFEKLREGGIEHLGQVRYAYLEPSGRVSIFKISPDRQTTGQSILPQEA